MSEEEDIPLNSLTPKNQHSYDSDSDSEYDIISQEFTDVELGEHNDTEDGDFDYKEIKKKFKVYAEGAFFATSLKKTIDVIDDGKQKTLPKVDLVSTDAYGQMEFLKASRKTRAKYLRLADTSNMDDVIHLFSNKWELPVHKLKMLISIIGSHNAGFTLRKDIQNCLIRGLRKIATTIKPWIVTSGTDGGIHRFVGNILQGHRYNETVLLGVTTWNIVKGRESLKNTLEEAAAIPYPPVHPIDEQYVGEDRNYELYLNKDHSHFLLVDYPETGDKERNTHFQESLFRANFEKKLIDEHHKISYERDNFEQENVEKETMEESFLPAIQILVSGGIETIEQAHLNLTMKNMHVFIIAESGGAADLLVKACNLYDRYHDEVDASFERSMASEIQRTFFELPHNVQAKLLNQIVACVQHKESITIYYTDNRKPLDELILLQLLNRHKHDKDYSNTQVKVNKRFFEKLNLASIWNRADIAKKKLFKGGGFASHPTELEDFMVEELAKNKVATVELLLESGFDIKSFDYDKLGQLYHKKFSEDDSWLAQFVDKRKVKLHETNLLRHEVEIEETRGMKGRKRGVGQRNLKKFINLQLIKESIIKLCGIDLFLGDFQKGYVAMAKLSHPFTELFLWAVLCNMHEMALMLWKRGEEVLAKALIARKIYKEMKNVYKKQSPFVDELVLQKLEDNANEFGNLALGILDECSNTGKLPTRLLLFKSYHVSSDITCWALASSSSFQEFFAHPVCQSIVMRRWLGNMNSYSKYQSYKVFFAVIFFPLVFMLNFQKQELTQNQKRRNKRGCCSNFFHNQISKMVTFYSAPVTKFWFNVLAYIAFLGFFIYVLQSKFTKTPTTYEWLVFAIIVSLTTEEIRQIINSCGTLPGQRLQSWWSQTWNKMDLVAILLFYVAFGFRMAQNTQMLEIGRILLTLDLMVWILRLLDFFAVNKKLGPYVVMIRRMTVDVFYFVVIFLVFWFAYGIARSIILESNEAFTFDDIRHFLIPYFQIYGEMFVSPMESDKNITMFGTKKHNSYNEGIVVAIMVVYVLLTNILLVNLLIAVFNNTYSNVQTNSNRVWKYQWYSLVEEYRTKPILVPPFIIVSHFFQLMNATLKYCCSEEEFMSLKRKLISTEEKRIESLGVSKLLKQAIEENEMFQLMKFEEECQQNYLYRVNATMTENQIVLDEMKKRTGEVERVLQTVVHELTQTSDKVSKLSAESQLVIQRLTKIEKVNQRLQIVGSPAAQSPRQKSSVPPKRSFDFRRVISTDPSSRKKTSRSLSDKTVNDEPHRLLGPSRSFPLADEAADQRLPPPTPSVRQEQPSSPDKEIYPEISIQSIYDNTAPQRRVISGKSSTTSSINDVRDSDDIYVHVIDEDPQSPSEEYKLDPLATYEYVPTRERKKQTVENINIRPISEYREFVHVLSRSIRYPYSDIRRFYFPDNIVDWDVPFPEYRPKIYTSPLISGGLADADTEEEDPNAPRVFNTNDGKIDRRSFCGIYQIHAGKPRNPMGRTGIEGRGCLKRFGPNHIIELIVTRFRKPTESSMDVDTLEVLVVMNESGEGCKLPSGEGLSQKPYLTRLKKLFSSSTLIDAGFSYGRSVMFHSAAISVFQEKNEYKIYEGYLDDERNTDNAWLETSVRHYHDSGDAIFKYFVNEEVVNRLKLKWIKLDENSMVPAYQLEYLREVANYKHVSFDEN